MKRILVVDDSPLARQVVRGVSVALVPNAVIVEAEDGAVALRHLNGSSFDLVVCDLNMPVMDGHAMLARMRGLSMHRRTPVIVLSSLVNPSNMAQLRAAGATVVLKKPFSNQQIRDAFKTVGLAA
ncbi:MAG: response regulator [Myxococcales bacterium]|nr:response regulator [Myxococcales bacterium]